MGFRERGNFTASTPAAFSFWFGFFVGFFFVVFLFFFVVKQEKYQGSGMCIETENHTQPKIADTLLWQITAHVPRSMETRRLKTPVSLH